MNEQIDITFIDSEIPAEGTVVLMAAARKKHGSSFRKLDKMSEGQLSKAVAAASFEGEDKKHVEILSPANLDLARIVIVGIGKDGGSETKFWQAVGGRLGSILKAGVKGNVTVMVEDLGKELKPSAAGAAAMASGFLLKNYSFDKYRTGKKKNEDGVEKLVFACPDPDQAQSHFKKLSAICSGVFLARDLVNEPANILGPVEFALKARQLDKLGVKVTLLDEAEMAGKNMNALLAVGQGSERESRLVVMQWSGGDDKDQPLAIVGKGVCFDSGGISIKPSAGMEDMKGDMGGAACVTGLMHALAKRKAKVNVVGVIALAENMPDGKAQRPGDVVTSMSGQTIEVINTDAEGRLVLADALTYTKDTFKPSLIIDLATLTGAILVALGKEHAGLFSNNDRLSNRLLKAGETTGEKLWRFPLGKEYDKLIDSKIADMKNVGGRYAGSITAAQFLKRYIGDVPWAHIDVAGTAMGSPKSDINESWGSGYGVMLLNEFIAANYE